MQTNGFSRRDMLRMAGPAAAAGGLWRGVLAAETGGEAKPAGRAVEPDGVVHGRLVPQLSLPFVDCEGTAFECGERLGSLWKSALTLEAEQAKDSRPWWKSPRCTPLMDKYCPYLPDVYRGMAKGAGVNENAMGQRAPREGKNTRCTSFALALHRTARLTERLQADRGRLTAALCYNAMCDHHGYPASVCRHETRQLLTAAAVIAEPTRGLLHVSPGAPCRCWPRTYSIGRTNAHGTMTNH